MKSKYLYFFIIIGFVFFHQSILFAENLEINSNNITADKNSKLIILEGNVEAVDSKNNQLSNYIKLHIFYYSLSIPYVF